MKVSVVVPAYNEEPLLPACLAALKRQDYEGEFEIIVVDNASTDRTGRIAAAAGVTVVEEPHRGYSKALARGFAAATGDIVATTDADSIVPSNWISRLVGAYEEGVAAVGGELDFTHANWKARLLTRGILPIINRVDRQNPAGPHLWGANFSVRRSAFLAAGGWNPEFNLQTDTELSERLRRFGRVVLLPDLVVKTSSRRWNRSLVTSSFLYATNFMSLRLRQRPLWTAFPNIRERLKAPGLVTRSRAAGRRPLAWMVPAATAITAIVFGIGVYDAVSPWSNAFGTTYWSGPASGLIALTFDDGPNQPYTSEILDILKREHIHATFFLIGNNVRRDPRTADRIVEEGHAIGNHSDQHFPGFALQPSEIVRADVDRAERTIHWATGVYPHLFRPPQGIRSPWLMSTLAKDSLVAVTWDDAPGDWLRLSAQTLVERTVEQARPGCIILLHDGLNLAPAFHRGATVAALPAIIHRLRAKGYHFVTVPELLHVRDSLSAWKASGGASPPPSLEYNTNLPSGTHAGTEAD